MLALYRQANGQSMTSRTCDHWQPCRTPFRQAVLQAASLEANPAEDCDGFVGQHTVGAAAVGNDLPRALEFRKPGLEFPQRDIHRSREVPQTELVFGTHIQN